MLKTVKFQKFTLQSFQWTKRAVHYSLSVLIIRRYLSLLLGVSVGGLRGAETVSGVSMCLIRSRRPHWESSCWESWRACSKVSLSSLGGTLGKSLLGHLCVYTDRPGNWAAVRVGCITDFLVGVVRRMQSCGREGHSHRSSVLFPSDIWLLLSSVLSLFFHQVEYCLFFHQLKLKLHKIISFWWIPWSILNIL